VYFLIDQYTLAMDAIFFLEKNSVCCCFERRRDKMAQFFFSYS